MKRIPKVHLVMCEDDRPIVEEISRQCQVTCWSRNLEEAVKWVCSGAPAEPDLFLINSSAYLVGQHTRLSRRDFLAQLKILKQNCVQARIVILIPLVLLGDLDLIKRLLKLQIYDVWFVESFDKWDINRFITQAQTPEGLEEYIKKLETELVKNERIDLAKSDLPSERIFRPYYIKSNVLAFYSAEDYLINTGVAVFAALNLAQMGFKVALVETITPLAQLAAAMNVRHPYFNTSHALTMHSLGNRDFLRKCLFNSTAYLTDMYSLDDFPHLQYYPDSLYLLPDGRRDDNLTAAEMQRKWPEFVAEVTRMVMFEQNYHFLIYLCNGSSPQNDFILQEQANLRYTTVSLLPGSVMAAMDMYKNNQGKDCLIFSGYFDCVAEELKEMNQPVPLFCIADVQKDILNYLYFKRNRKIAITTQEFMANLLSRAGVQQQPALGQGGSRSGVAFLKESIWRVIKNVKSF